MLRHNTERDEQTYIHTDRHTDTSGPKITFERASLRRYTGSTRTTLVVGSIILLHSETPSLSGQFLSHDLATGSSRQKRTYKSTCLVSRPPQLYGWQTQFASPYNGEGGSLKRDPKAGSGCMYVCSRRCIVTSHKKNPYFVKRMR